MATDKTLPSQGRDAPAYQEFAASMMAKLSYREMSLAERGLLYTMRNECWVNRRLPCDPVRLARVLGYDVEEIKAALPRVMEFFEVMGDSLTSPELEKYRQYQDARRERMSEGGKASAEKRKRAKRTQDKGATDASTLQAPSKLASSNLQALRQDQTRPDQEKTVSKEVVADDDWLRDYEHAETSADDYFRASRGG